jgi:RNA-splicing ligase RtcB
MADHHLGYAVLIGGVVAYVDSRIWIGVHFGSRGLGHKTATFFLNSAGAKDGMEVDPCVIPAQSDLGIDYLECMRLSGLYAYAGRDWVCGRVARDSAHRWLKRFTTTTTSRGASITTARTCG